MMENVTTLIQPFPCHSQPRQGFESLPWGCPLSVDSVLSQTGIIATNVSVPPQKQ